MMISFEIYLEPAIDFPEAGTAHPTSHVRGSTCIRSAENGESVMDKKAKTCKHAACSCTTQDGKDYCSDTCKDARKVTELTCQCNHPECRGEPAKA